MATPAEPITIKRYASRRLYNPRMGVHITLDELAAMVEDDKQFVVCEAETGKDVTHLILKQIILQRGTHG